MQAFRGLIVTSVVFSTLPAFAAERFLLAEDSSSRSTWSIENRVTGNGTFEFQAGANANGAVTHPVEIAAVFRYRECRLPSAGRGEAAWRALRRYDEATSGISVGGHTSSPQLRPDRRRIVVRADRAGLLPYSPDGPLTSQEVELLPSLGDPLLLAALLPEREVTVGETWNPQPWVGPALAGTEVSFNSSVNCQLKSVASNQALIKVEGSVSGAAKGSTSETTLAGSIVFDVNLKTIVSGELTQTEKRSIGPVTPGMTLKLTSKLLKSAAVVSESIQAEEIDAIPLEPSEESLQIEHQLEFGAKLVCERDWIAVQQTGTLLVLRLLDHGGIVAQCNIAPAPNVQPGQRTDERQFQNDIRRSLGDQLREIASAEEVKGSTAQKIYRVTAVGRTGESDMVWRYYLVSSPDGRQAALVFTAEASQLPRLADRDSELVNAIEFVAQIEPTVAKPKSPSPSLK